MGTEKPTCQICHSSKHIVPVIFGLPSRKGLKKARKGKLAFGGCFIPSCAAHWYCTKDKVGILLIK